MKRVFLLLLTLVAAIASGALRAEAQAWVMSIPHALSSQNIYKVQLLSIDGASLPNAIQYPVNAGKRTIELELMLDIEWEPDLIEGERPAQIKRLELQVEEGKSYWLAARVDVDAPAESQLDQSWWEVFIFRVHPDR
jgi:hypothetical protein